MDGLHLVHWGPRDNRPPEIRDYDTMFAGEDRRNAVTLAGEIKDAQAGVVPEH